MVTDYRKSHLAPDKGERYHAEFTDSPYRNMVWQFEQELLDRIAGTFYKDTAIEHLDFACGTGRILSFYNSYAESSVGVDLSPSMLQVARDNNPDAEFHEADLTQNDVLGERKFNLITAFRFFPNAEPELRSAAMRVVAGHLADKGCLVFNNHKNTASTRNRLARLFGRRNFQGMSTAEARALLAENDMEIVQTYSLCAFPASEQRTLLPRFLLEPLERLLAAIPLFAGLGENQLHVCKKKVS